MLEIPEVLQAFLQRKRPHGGAGELYALGMVKKFILDAGALYSQDSIGNIECNVGNQHGLVFTAHVDTVHRDEGTLSLFITEPDNMVVADGMDGKAAVLGADDASGLYILLSMIAAKKPGKYLFFVGEEVGGIGSSAYVRARPAFSADMVVSFDRRGTDSIITHQGGYETCSDVYARALAQALNMAEPTFGYKTDSTGLYTDSREFAELVPECTNVSVGYYNEHTVYECQDLGHLLALKDAAIAIDWAALPIARTPAPDLPWSSTYGTLNDDIPWSYSTRKEAREALDAIEAGLLDPGTTLPTNNELRAYIDTIRGYLE